MAEKILYITQVTSIGGMNGHIRSSDIALDLELAAHIGTGKRPGKKKGTNPVQLFAACLASCFETVLQTQAKFNNIDPGNTAVTAKVELLRRDEELMMKIELSVSVPGLPPSLAKPLLGHAEASCLFCKALRNNVPIKIVLL